jgi:hypothetical protein
LKTAIVGKTNTTSRIVRALPRNQPQRKNDHHLPQKFRGGESNYDASPTHYVMVIPRFGCPEQASSADVTHALPLPGGSKQRVLASATLKTATVTTSRDRAVALRAFFAGHT